MSGSAHVKASKPWALLPPDEQKRRLDLVTELNRQGFGITEIQRRADVSWHIAKRIVDPGFLEARQRVRTEQIRSQRGGLSRYVERDREPANPIRPPAYDTRSLTGVLCGDPLPGRSALDRRVKLDSSFLGVPVQNGKSAGNSV